MPFELQPMLRGELVELRPLRPDDRAALYAVAADPLIWEQRPDNRHEKPVFDELFQQSLASGGALIALDAETRAIIGSSRYHEYSEQRSEVEIGSTFLARRCWGGRYNGEIVFVIDVDNLRSRRAVEKIGAVLSEGRDERGRLLYKISRSAWA